MPHAAKSRSFDPCLSCAVHVMRPKEGAKVFAIGPPAAGKISSETVGVS
jgi:hypothetical protein